MGAGDAIGDLRAQFGGQIVELEQCPRVDVHLTVDNELQTRQLHARLGGRERERLTVTSRPGSSRVASRVPTTAGMPSSRALFAAWQVRTPRFVTIAKAFFMIGPRSGSVMSATSTSPARKLAVSSMERSTLTAPDPIFCPIARPVARTSLRSVCSKRRITFASARETHDLRTRLEDVQRAVDTVARPLDIHRPPVVLLDRHRETGKLFDLGIRDAEQPPLLGRTSSKTVVPPTWSLPVYRIAIAFSASARFRIAGRDAVSAGL